MFSSCSTKKNSWVNRKYHNLTAKYNGYFNGKESLKKGVKQIYKDHKDDYSTILPVYKIRDLEKAKKAHTHMDKAIRKGSVVIQKHSMKIKGKEYCKWVDDNYLLVGKGYFYKGEFDDAIKTFLYIKNEYPKNDIRFSASIWALRSYVQKRDFLSAELELSELKQEKRMPNTFNLDFVLASAEYYLFTKNTDLALEQLKKAGGQIKRKRNKVRYSYIMAQIHQQNNDYIEAKKQYEKVTKSNAEYEMIFNAKMNLALLLEKGSRDLEKMRGNLIKMTKDDKNKEYLDQIYYTLAQVDHNNQDTASAKNNYILSTKNSINNDPQKAISFLALGEIEYNKSNYNQAKTYYDSTIFYMSNDFRLYEVTKEKHKVLADLVFNIETILLEDSLQFLAQLPNHERNTIINQIIERESQKEKEEMQNERLKNQMLNESIRNRGKDNQFGLNTSGGKWYFYNPATLSFGLSEFRKKWGKRKLEDNWRRKNKNNSNNLLVDSISADSSLVVNGVVDKKNPKYYLDRLPKSDSDFVASNSKIKEAYYQAGLLYRDGLGELQKSTDMFAQITFRFPEDSSFSILAHYNIYINQIYQGQHKEAELTKQTLIKKHPNSIYIKKILDPEFNQNQVKKQNKESLVYEEIYSKFLDKKYKETLLLTEVDSKKGHKSKYMFLRALSYLGLKDTISAKKELTKIVNIEPGSQLAKKAHRLVALINDPSEIIKANEIAISGSPYFLKKSAPHMTIIVTPKKSTDINYLKMLISDHHSLDYENESYEITAMLLGPDRHIIMIKQFNNAYKALEYNDLFIENKKIKEELSKNDFRIMAISLENFREFYRNKDMQGYYNFYLNNYTRNN